jgi:hypothetical protein
MDVFGRLKCTKCEVYKHIDNYYITNKQVTWYIVDGTPYGKPHPWCKECCKEYMRGRYVPASERGPRDVQTAEPSTISLKDLVESPGFQAATPKERGEMLLLLSPEEYLKLSMGKPLDSPPLEQ